MDKEIKKRPSKKKKMPIIPNILVIIKSDKFKFNKKTIMRLRDEKLVRTNSTNGE
jgi:hypothetical protein